ncbi:MAG: PAS domain S-box protein, partial [Candidatus Nanopelagicales bacterium]
MTATPITNQVGIDATDPELLEDRWRSALKSHIDPFAVLELVTDASGAPVDLRYVEANPAAIAYHDTTADDLLGHTMLEFYPGLSTDGPLTRYLRTAITGEPVIFDDYPYFNELKGERRWYDLRAVRCRNGIALTWRDATDRHNSAVELARSEEQFRLLVSNMYGVVLLSVNNRVIWISPAVGGLLGMSAEELSGASTTHLWHPDDRERAIALHERAYGGHTATDVLRIRNAQGRFLSVEVAVAPYSSDEFQTGAVIYMRDVTDKVAAEVALAEREALYRILAENAMDLILSTDTDGTVLWASPSVQAVLGYRPGELAGQGLSMIIHPEDAGVLRLSVGESPQRNGTTARARFVTKSGTPRWMEATPRVAHDLNRKAAAVVIAVRDIDEQVRTEIALERELHFDSLTGLAKRELALLRTREILDGLRGRSWAVLCVGVNGLTAINQAHTYGAGDLVLQTVADRLVAAAGAHDRVARVTGDEFAVLVTDVVTSHDAALAAERLLAAVRGRVPWEGEGIEISGYVGIAL